MRERKIGCLPVLEDEALVGIVTGIDLLDALLRLTGVTEPSGRPRCASLTALGSSPASRGSWRGGG